jgi:hypothetical protein
MIPMTRIILTIIVILMALTGCGPASTPLATITPNVQSVADKSSPITEDKIARDIVGKNVQISDETGDDPSNKWTFEADEYRHVEILESQRTDDALMIVISMTTRNNPKPDEESIQVSGKLRLIYEQDGAKKWVLSQIENLTFKYSIGVGV